MIEELTERAEDIYCSALEIASPDQRKVFLDRTCQGQAGLRVLVDRLLAAQSAAEKFFQEGGVTRLPVEQLAQSLADTPGLAENIAALGKPDESSGKLIGPYKLLQKIGEGGCGMVYMADQEKPVRRRVALKIIKLGMDTKNVIARFEAEREALALMDHPNIARVLDAGATETGRPYFVMELVRGVKITEYCDQNELDTQRRLDLFIQVCQAIQHAHQKGVIHRDIKPSNILVTIIDGAPVPKVIDFGIAKAVEGRLTDNTIFTAYEQFIGTPAYMSPEQAVMSGVDVDTRSDIYSLGVLLYELLTGRTPFETKDLLQNGVDGLRRTLQNREPQRPSAMVTTLQGPALTQVAQCRRVEPLNLISTLRGDLDWIVIRTLEKDRARRYETANGLAMDIRRYLDNEPVLARPPSRRYRLQKLVRRNQGVFASGLAVALTLAVSLGVSIWLLLREHKMHERAVAAEQAQVRLREIAEEGLATEAELRRQSEAREKIVTAADLINRAVYVDADSLIAQIPLEYVTMEGVAVFRVLGDWNAIEERWPAARERFRQLQRASRIEDPGFTSLDITRTAVALIECDDREGYENFCQDIIKTFRKTSDPIVAERAVKNCLLLPASQARIAALEPLAQLARQSLTETDFNDKSASWPIPWRCLTLALWEYRTGHDAEAITWSRRCLGYGDHPSMRAASARTILALALFRSGEVTEARSELAQARAVVDERFKRRLEVADTQEGEGYWFDWVLGRILVQEAAALMEKPFSSEK